MPDLAGTAITRAWTTGRMLTTGIVFDLRYRSDMFLSLIEGPNEALFADRVEVPKHVLVRFLEKESVFLNLETEIITASMRSVHGCGKWLPRRRPSKMLMRSC